MDLIKRTRFWSALGFLVQTRVGGFVSELMRGVINRFVALSDHSKRRDETPWTPLTRPLDQCCVTVVSTAGFYVDGDDPFDVDSAAGDATFRVIPSDVDKAQLRIAHHHYSHARAMQDANVLLPIDRLRELAEARVIDRVAPTFFSFGFGAGLTREYVDKPDGTAHQVVERLKRERVDAVVIVPA